MQRRIMSSQQQHQQQQCSWPHLTCVLAPLLLLLLLVVSPQMASATAGSLLAERNNHTYMYTFYRYNVDLIEQSFEQIFVRNQTDISIYTAEMNRMYAQFFANTMKTQYPAMTNYSFSFCESLVFFEDSYETCAHFYLRASTVFECRNTFGSCCPWYWVTDSMPAELPIAQVDPRYFFWDGTKALNGFFTNFTQYELDTRNCSAMFNDRVKPYLISDPEGGWASTPSHSLVLISELDVKPADLVTSGAQAVLSRDPGSVFLYRTFFYSKIPQVAMIVVAVVLLVLLLLELLLIWLVSTRPTEREIAALQAELAEDTNSEPPAPREDTASEMPSKLSPSPMPHRRSRSASSAAASAPPNLPRSSSLPRRPKSSRAPCPPPQPQQHQQQRQQHSQQQPQATLQRQLSRTSQRPQAQPSAGWSEGRRQWDPNASSRSCLFQQQQQNGSFFSQASYSSFRAGSQSANPLYSWER